MLLRDTMQAMPKIQLDGQAGLLVTAEDNCGFPPGWEALPLWSN